MEEEGREGGREGKRDGGGMGATPAGEEVGMAEGVKNQTTWGERGRGA